MFVSPENCLAWDRLQWDQSNPKMRLEKGIQMYLSAFLFLISNLNLKFGSPAPASPIGSGISTIVSLAMVLSNPGFAKASGKRMGYPVLKHGLLENPPFWSVMFWENKAFMVDFPTHVGFEGKQFLVNKVQASTRTSRELTSVSWTV